MIATKNRGIIKMYLSGRTQQFFDKPDLFGCMFSYKKTGRQNEALQAGCYWMLDNGAFTGNFVFDKWVMMLLSMRAYVNTCIGIVIPDHPYDAEKTLVDFERYAPLVKALGFPVALATQNGMKPSDVPWDDIDVLFVGGDDAHKRGPEARRLINEAKSRLIWVHVGRVSSGRAIGQHWPDADSWDGTTFTKEKAGGEGEGKKFQEISATLTNLQRGNYALQKELFW